MKTRLSNFFIKEHALDRRDLNAVLIHMRDEYGRPSVRCIEKDGSFECECRFRNRGPHGQLAVSSNSRFDTPLQAANECLRRIENLFEPLVELDL